MGVTKIHTGKVFGRRSYLEQKVNNREKWDVKDNPCIVDSSGTPACSILCLCFIGFTEQFIVPLEYRPNTYIDVADCRITTFNVCRDS